MKYTDFEQITRRRSLSGEVESRSVLEQVSLELLSGLFPIPKSVRLLGVTLSSLNTEREPTSGSCPWASKPDRALGQRHCHRCRSRAGWLGLMTLSGCRFVRYIERGVRHDGSIEFRGTASRLTAVARTSTLSVRGHAHRMAAMDRFDHLLNWTLKQGSHPFPGQDGGTLHQ